MIANVMGQSLFVEGKVKMMKSIESCFTHSRHPVRVLQFGEGRFMRAFVDYAIDVANEEQGFDGNVVIVTPRAARRPEAFVRQKNLYTVRLQGRQNGRKVVSNRVITCINDVLSPIADYDAYMALARLDTLEYITSNTTDGGIVFSPDDKLEDRPPRTYPAKLTQFLFARYQYFKGAEDKGVVILPVELIDHNGQTLRACVERYAALWNLPAAFLQWLDKTCQFTDTLVDRIVTGYPDEQTAQAIQKESGYRDELLDVAEPFALWAIENPGLERRLPFTSAYFQAIFTSDITVYKERKVRILNGAHTSMVLGAYLAGLDYVGQCMADEDIRSSLEQTVYKEILPTVPMNPKDVRSFADAVFERFENPFVHHELLAISLNSIAKWKVRVLPSLKDSLAATGKLPRWLSYSMAALLAFYRSKDKGDDCLIGHRGSNIYPIRDDADRLAFIASHAALPDAGYVAAVLQQADWWGEDLTAIPGFSQAVTAHLARIGAIGVRAHIREMVNEL